MPKRDTQLVYSTDKGRLCPDCGQAKTACRCLARTTATAPTGDGIVRIHRQTKGRGGKAVSVITGLALSAEALKELAKTLKQRCGTGGAVKDGTIEIQGEQREVLKAALEKQGFTVKLSGG